MRPLRRTLLSLFVAAIGLSVFSPHGRTEQKALTRIGIIIPEGSWVEQQLREALRARGYVDGETVKIDWRRYKNWDATMRASSAALVRSAPDLIIVFGTPPARVVLDETKSIPVVFSAGDPVATGLVPSLSRPGGNATGSSVNAIELSAKLLDLVTQLVPRGRRIVAVRNPANPLSLAMVKGVQSIAQTLRVEVLVMDAQSADELVQGLAPIDKRKADAILIPPDFVFQLDKERIVRAVRNTGLPAIYQEHVFAKAGGLVSYGPDLKEVVQSVATLVDKILKGANPGDLPVEQVSKLGLTVNLKTAKDMGIAVPESILTRADQVIR